LSYLVLYLFCLFVVPFPGRDFLTLHFKPSWEHKSTWISWKFASRKTERANRDFYSWMQQVFSFLHPHFSPLRSLPTQTILRPFLTFPQRDGRSAKTPRAAGKQPPKSASALQAASASCACFWLLVKSREERKIYT